jgi:hypothetical protein
MGSPAPPSTRAPGPAGAGSLHCALPPPCGSAPAFAGLGRQSAVSLGTTTALSGRASAGGTRDSSAGSRGAAMVEPSTWGYGSTARSCLGKRPRSTGSSSLVRVAVSEGLRPEHAQRYVLRPPPTAAGTAQLPRPGAIGVDRPDYPFVKRASSPPNDHATAPICVTVSTWLPLAQSVGLWPHPP